MPQVNITFNGRPTSCCVSGNRRRAPRVGLRSGKGKRYTLAERLAARTIQGPGCWIVEGYQLPNGYVQVSLRSDGGTAIYAHRLAWELTHGPIPDGLCVLHQCDEPRCARVSHLFLGTQADNVADAMRKGRHTAWMTTGVRLNGQPAATHASKRPILERVPSRQLPILGEVA